MQRVLEEADGSVARVFFFFQAEDGIRYWSVTGVQTCALPISRRSTCGPTKKALRNCRRAFLRARRRARSRLRRNPTILYFSTCLADPRISTMSHSVDRKSVV